MTKWDPLNAAEWSEVSSLLSDVLEWSFSGWTLRVIASLDQRIDYQVKCDRSILFGATKREVVVKTTTTKTTTTAVVAKYIQKRREKTKPNRFLEAKPNSYRWPNTCKGTQLMKKGRGGPYQPGEPR